jgi:hypothetical protein
MPSIWCQEESYLKNFVQQVKTLYNSIPFVCAFYAFKSPLFYSHHDHEGDIMVIPFAIGTRQSDPFGGALFALIHFTALHFYNYLFPSLPISIHYKQHSHHRAPFNCIIWVWVTSNKPKLMSKCQLFYNSCYICLCVAILMACESWKVVFIE